MLRQDADVELGGRLVHADMTAICQSINYLQVVAAPKPPDALPDSGKVISEDGQDGKREPQGGERK